MKGASEEGWVSRAGAAKRASREDRAQAGVRTDPSSWGPVEGITGGEELDSQCT